MDYRSLGPDDAPLVEELFRSVFTESAGEQEGALVGRLAGELLACVGSHDVCGFAAVDRNRIVGAIFFSRLTFDPPREAFLLSPVAVRSDQQGRGIGQELIAHGLGGLARRGVSLVATYGDPAFYGKVGFAPISPEAIRPPHALSRPEGWLGQCLAGDALQAVTGRCFCVKAFDDPALW